MNREDGKEGMLIYLRLEEMDRPPKPSQAPRVVTRGAAKIAVTEGVFRICFHTLISKAGRHMWLRRRPLAHPLQ